MNESDLKEAFKLIDLDGNGLIEIRELKKFFNFDTVDPKDEKIDMD